MAIGRNDPSTTGVSNDINPAALDELDEGRVIMGERASTSTRASSRPSDKAIVGDSYHDNDGPGPQVMSADTLTGDKVANMAGEDLGEIEAIMLDVQSGRVAYAVLSFGGFLGMGDKLFAIPWQALQLDAENKCFILNVDKERLRNAPGFDKDHWPAMADLQWASSVHSYYGSRPYWMR